MVHGIQTVVVDLGLGLMLRLYELGRRLHLVRLGGGVGRQPRQLLSTLHLRKTLCIRLSADAASFPQHIEFLVLERPVLVVAP
jgi:hypothetical protein